MRKIQENAQRVTFVWVLAKLEAHNCCIFWQSSCRMSAPETRVSLIMRVRDVQDQGAWGEFVALYTPIVYGFWRSRGLSGADAEDVTQEVFRALAKALPNFQLDQSIGTFRNRLFTVTRSKMNSMLAKSQRLPQMMEELPDRGVLPQIGSNFI